MTGLYILAIALPLIFVAIDVCCDVFPKMFASWSVQHHGGTSDVFSNDLDYSVQTMQFNDFNMTLFRVMDNFNYFKYDVTITNLNELITSIDGANYSTIQELCDSHLLIDFSVISLFDNGLVNYGTSISPYLFADFFFVYLVNISVICFLPEVLLAFVTWCRNLVYSFVEKGENV